MQKHMLPMTGIAGNLKRCDFFFFRKPHFSRDRVKILTSRRDSEVDGCLANLLAGCKSAF